MPPQGPGRSWLSTASDLDAVGPASPKAPAPGGTGLAGFSYGQIAEFGQMLGIGGTLMSAAGAYYSAEASRYQLKSQSLDLEFQKTQAGLNARAAEGDAQQILEDGKEEVGRVGLQYREVKGASRAAIGASGVQAGVGNAAEVQASIEYAKEVDSITVNANAVRAANAARTRSVNYRNQGLLAGTAAKNAMTMRRAISPAGNAGISLVGGAGDVARSWAAFQRDSARYRKEY